MTPFAEGGADDIEPGFGEELGFVDEDAIVFLEGAGTGGDGVMEAHGDAVPVDELELEEMFLVGFAKLPNVFALGWREAAPASRAVECEVVGFTMNAVVLDEADFVDEEGDFELGIVNERLDDLALFVGAEDSFGPLRKIGGGPLEEGEAVDGMGL